MGIGVSSLVPLQVPVGPELLVILLVLVLLFGANKIPKLARATGESIGEFRRGRMESEVDAGGDDEVDQARESIEEELGADAGPEEAEPQRETN